VPRILPLRKVSEEIKIRNGMKIGLFSGNGLWWGKWAQWNSFSTVSSSSHSLQSMIHYPSSAILGKVNFLSSLNLHAVSRTVRVKSYLLFWWHITQYIMNDVVTLSMSKRNFMYCTYLHWIAYCAQCIMQTSLTI